MSGEVSTSAPVAAAYAGQEYQCLVGWYYALLLLDPEGDVTSVSVEAPKVGPVDDVVIGSRTRSGKYVQVKFSVDSTNPIDEDFWTGKTDGGQSFLQRLWKTFNELRKTDPNVALVLHANRPIYSEHPILKFRHSKTGRLDPALRAGKAKRAREQWEKHLGVTTDELLDLLEHLEINIDQRSEREFFEAIADRMAAYQLSRDIEVGRSIVRRWIIDGVRSVDRDQLRREIDTHKLHAKPPTALLVVQAIDHHKDAAQADASVDWVDLFEGDHPRIRRQLKDPTLWNERLYRELERATKIIENSGKNRVVIRGAARLTTAFLIGQFLPDTRGIQLEYEQHGSTWRTMVEAAPFDVHTTQVECEARGDDLAVGINVTQPEFEKDVVEYIRSSNLPVRGLLPLRVPKLDNRAIVNDAAARGFVQGIRERINAEIRARRPPKIHLFFATPFPVALFLGHFWNRLPPVQLYEDLGPGAGYTPTFLVRA